MLHFCNSNEHEKSNTGDSEGSSITGALNYCLQQLKYSIIKTCIEVLYIVVITFWPLSCSRLVMADDDE